ncbi:FecR family protein [Fodinibius roseus]|nr:FecR domain-containing protein [Fodinibius roseus]
MSNPEHNEYKKRWDALNEAPLEKDQREQIKSRIVETLSLSEQNAVSRSAFPKYAYVLTAAASLLLLAAILLGLHLNTNPVEDGLETKEYRTSVGETKRVQLFDGTQIWLNANSRLSVPANYNQANRVISLRGEAYFEVQPDSQHPFRVHSNGMSTQVLGTKFNVRSYRDDSLQYVSVVEGKVRVQTRGQDKNSFMKSKKQIDLEAGEQVQADVQKLSLIKKKMVNTKRIAAWRSGTLQFTQTPLKQVADDFSRRFGVMIRFAKPEMHEIRITGTFDNDSWEEIIEMICLSTDLNYEIADSTITIH